MKVVGYTDRISVEPGESVRVMVSCDLPEYRADLMRVAHGDPSPEGPGVKEEIVASPANGRYPGRRQALRRGSYVLVPDSPALRFEGSFTIQAYVYPTKPQKGVQGIATKWSGDTGFGLFIDELGSLALWVGDASGTVEKIGSSVPLVQSQWYVVAASFDASAATVSLHQENINIWAPKGSSVTVQRRASVSGLATSDAPLVIAGYSARENAGIYGVSGHFNGKIEGARLYDRALSRNEIFARPSDGLIAAWDFGRDFSSAHVTDVSGSGQHGTIVNMPARAVTGHNWKGRETDFSQAPDQYAAIHFHEDDLEDAGWETDFEVRVPDATKSGVYAVRLQAGDGPGSEDYLPLFVRPKRGVATAPVLFLAPTNTYLAYANEHMMAHPTNIARYKRIGYTIPQDYPSEPGEKFAVEHQLLSLYDRHSDDSGVCYSSRLRPIPNLSPKYNWMAPEGRSFRARLLSADLHLLDWMESQGFDYDVATDEDLHREGNSLLARYRVVVTGSHPEYWTEQSLDAMEAYVAEKGRLMYLGGNGFYWVTSFDPERPHVIEVRRWGGTGTWRAQPGEYHHSTTGEIGGLWRNRGRAPQRLTGVGFTAQGSGPAVSYRRNPDSFDPRAAFIFDGVGEDEPIGDFGLVLGGAAGHEVDRSDVALGTAPDALVLATATGLSDLYQHCVEEMFTTDPKQGGTVNPDVRAEMVYTKGPSGGAVFSVGSITWCGALSHDGYDNNVSRITGNVLRRFSSEGPLP